MTLLVQALGWTLLHFLWQGTLLAGVVALALWTLEGRDSRLRYAVACGGLLLMLAAPPLTFIRMRMQPSTRVQAPLKSPAPAAPTATALSPLQTPDHDWRGNVDRAMPWVVLLWASGSLVMSLRLTGGWVWLQWLRRRPDTHPAPDAEQLLLLRLCQRMGVGSNLRLLLCKSVAGPTVLGWLKPVILIPPAMLTGLSPQQLELILAHELAHVLRHDYLVNLFQSIAEVLFFFHPAVWWVSKKIRQEREQASDPQQVDAIIHGQAALAPIEKKPGMLVIQRINSFTDKGGLLPQGLDVYVWAGDVPADLVLQALDDLEAMTPKAGIRQEIRRLISPGMGKAPKIRVDVEDADPIDVRNILETAMAQPKP